MKRHDDNDYMPVDDRISDRENAANTCQRHGAELTGLDDIQVMPVEWLWLNWLALGKLHLLAGAPGAGKTTLALDMAATISTAGQWPDGTHTSAGDVVIWSGEDDAADTLKPRLLAAGADPSRITLLTGMWQHGRRTGAFNPARDMKGLVEAMHDCHPVLVILDPAVATVTGDSHKNAEVRRGLQPWVDLAQNHHCAVLGISHFSKATHVGSDPLERICGSVAFSAVSRLVMLAGEPSASGPQSASRILIRAKSNLGPSGDGFCYDIQHGPLPDQPGITAARVVWGEHISGRARELMEDMGLQAVPGLSTTDQATARWLCALLQSFGPMPTKQVAALAERDGIHSGSLKRARKHLGVRANKLITGTRSEWWLRMKGQTRPIGRGSAM